MYGCGCDSSPDSHPGSPAAYRAPDHAYLLFVRFTTRECGLAANGHFLEELKKLLNSVIADLTCHIAEATCSCRSVQTPRRGLRRELFLRFQGDRAQRRLGRDRSFHKQPERAVNSNRNTLHTSRRGFPAGCGSPGIFSH